MFANGEEREFKAADYTATYVAFFTENGSSCRVPWHNILNVWEVES